MNKLVAFISIVWYLTRSSGPYSLCWHSFKTQEMLCAFCLFVPSVKLEIFVPYCICFAIFSPWHWHLDGPLKIGLNNCFCFCGCWISYELKNSEMQWKRKSIYKQSLIPHQVFSLTFSILCWHCKKKMLFVLCLCPSVQLEIFTFLCYFYFAILFPWQQCHDDCLNMWLSGFQKLVISFLPQKNKLN